MFESCRAHLLSPCTLIVSCYAPASQRASAAALDACLQAARQLEDGHDAVLAQHQRQAEQARYNATRAERRYRAVDPDNRLVARGLEREWETALRELADAEAELARRATARPKTLTPQEKQAILALGDDLGAVGTLRPPPTRTASSCCAPCWMRSTSRCAARTPARTPAWCCGGKAARSAS